MCCAWAGYVIRRLLMCNHGSDLNQPFVKTLKWVITLSVSTEVKDVWNMLLVINVGEQRPVLLFYPALFLPPFPQTFLFSVSHVFLVVYSQYDGPFTRCFFFFFSLWVYYHFRNRQMYGVILTQWAAINNSATKTATVKTGSISEKLVGNVVRKCSFMTQWTTVKLYK